MNGERKDFYKVPSANWERLKKEIESLSRRSERLGGGPIHLVEVKKEVRNLWQKEEGGVIFEGPEKSLPGWILAGLRTYHIVRIEGNMPHYQGWQLFGSLQHSMDSEVGTIVRNLPDREIPPLYRKADGICQHCGVQRNRKETYVLCNQKGEFIQVGSSCLQDFLGTTAPDRVGALAEVLMNARETAVLASGEDKQMLDRDFFLSMVAAVIREKGWVARKEAREEHKRSTSDVALDLIHGRLKDPVEITDGDRELVGRALGWLETWRDKDDLDDYMWNLRVACAQNAMPLRNAGIVASLIPAYAKRKIFNKVKVGYIGEEGAIDNFALTLKAHSRTEKQDYYRFVDNKGASAVWFSKQSLPLEIGKTYQVRAAIRRHEIWQNKPRTVLGFVEVVDTLPREVSH